jgi:hypothetical protein
MSYLNPHTHRLDRGKSLADMTAEIRANNVEKGWRSAKGGPGDNTWGDYIALLHSEISEALEAYRDWKLEDATEQRVMPVKHCPACGEPGAGFVNGSAFCNRCNWQGLPKPEGVGSEFADMVIRLLDMCDVFGLTVFDMDMELDDVSLIPLRGETFGDHVAWLHHCAAVLIADSDGNLAGFLRALVSVAERYGINLTAEYERKIAYNRTRSFQHGGRTLSGTGA